MGAERNPIELLQRNGVIIIRQWLYLAQSLAVYFLKYKGNSSDAASVVSSLNDPVG